MPIANPFAPTIEVGGQGSASAGPVSLGGKLNFGVQDHHSVAAYVLIGLAALFLLHRAHFRFSSTVGG